MDTIKLPYCWVCKNPSSLHEHHVVPQAYGGRDGPTVTLCASCHNGVHHVADGRDNMQPSYWVTHETLKKGSALVKIIKDSRVIASKSANKKVQVTLELTAEQAKMLDKLKVMLGESGRVSTLLTLINQEYQRLTIR